MLSFCIVRRYTPLPFFFFFLKTRRPPRSTPLYSSAASDVYKRQENIALATLLIPFAGALITSILPNRMAKWLCTLFALLATLGTVVLGWQFLAEGKVDTTITLVQYGDVALFGFTIDRVSTLIAFAVVFLGLLVSFYSTGYLTNGNREHPHDGTRRYYAFLLIFIGAMAGFVLSSTILGQLLVFVITGGCSLALIGYYQSEK